MHEQKEASNEDFSPLEAVLYSDFFDLYYYPLAHEVNPSGFFYSCAAIRSITAGIPPSPETVRSA